MATTPRLIDANKLQAVLQNMVEHLTENGDALIAACLLQAQEIVDQQRTIDAVAVIRCEYCEHHNDINCAMNEWNQPDDVFCSYATRKSTEVETDESNNW